MKKSTKIIVALLVFAVGCVSVKVIIGDENDEVKELEHGINTDIQDLGDKPDSLINR